MPVTTDKTSAYIDLVKKNESAMQDDRCTSCAEKIMNTIGTGTPAKCDESVLSKLSSGKAAEGLYYLKISVGAGLGWQHGLVLQKTDGDIILYQGWVGQFSLGEWLSNQASGKMYKQCYDSFSPCSKNYRFDQMQAWLGMLTLLESEYDRYDENDSTGGDFASLVKQIFGIGTFTSKDHAQITMGKRYKYELKLEWSYLPLRPLY